MTRAWIVPKSARTCSSYGYECNNTRPRGSKFKLNKETGVAHFYCATCRKTHETKLNSWKERRPCKLCQYVRNVTVTAFSWKQDGAAQEHAEEYCDACKQMLSCWSHLRTAADQKAKAVETYMKRGVDVPTLEQYRKVLASR